MNDTPPGAPLAYSIKEASRATSLGRTRLYQLIAAGRLEAVKIGNRTLITAKAKPARYPRWATCTTLSRASPSTR